MYKCIQELLRDYLTKTILNELILYTCIKTGDRLVWTNFENQPHNIHGPAEICFHMGVKSKTWYKNGVINRTNGPAYTSFYDNGFIYVEIWYNKWLFHRDNGPALIRYDINGTVKSEIWFRNGKRHREGHPAIKYYHVDGNVMNEEYWIDGIQIKT